MRSLFSSYPNVLNYCVLLLGGTLFVHSAVVHSHYLENHNSARITASSNSMALVSDGPLQLRSPVG